MMMMMIRLMFWKVFGKYTCMFKHCYMPQSMMHSVIVPLVKNKSGDLTNKITICQ